MYRFLLGFLFIFLVSSCTTRSQIPDLQTVKLENLVVQTDDLSPNIIGRLEDAGVMLADPHIAQVYYKLVKQEDNNVVGQINVTLYKDTVDAKARYDQTHTMIAEPLSNVFPLQSLSVGEHAYLQIVQSTTSVAFVRCHAYAIVNLEIPADMMIAYVTRLDERLKASICP